MDPDSTGLLHEAWEEGEADTTAEGKTLLSLVSRALLGLRLHGEEKPLSRRKGLYCLLLHQEWQRVLRAEKKKSWGKPT